MGLFSASTIIDGVKELGSLFIESPEKRNEFTLKSNELITKKLSELEQTTRMRMKAKQDVLVAELAQGDKFTKRARPTVVYTGLVFIAINYVLFPLIARVVGLFNPDLVIDTSPLANLPEEFWWAWGGICTTWSIGRSAERLGVKNKLVSAITGTPTKPPKNKNVNEDDDWGF